MKVFAACNLSELYFFDDLEKRQTDQYLEVNIEEDQFNKWLETDLYDYIDEFEELPIEINADPLTDEWDKKYNENVKVAAAKLKERGMLSGVICNFLNELEKSHPFYMATLEKIRKF